LQELLKDRHLFKPHVVASERSAPGRDPLAGNAAWSSLYLWKSGSAVDEIAARCPETVSALANVPLSHFSRFNPSAPSIMFSLLAAGARIPPHTGATNARLVCHLPLIVPPNCGFRVGNETRRWEEGKLLIFDDTIEHEAWNDSGEDRIVLIFDIWRPELSEEERAAVRTLFSALERVRA
jgi:aspartyl/asparaginyl beta-hydroxylase (cupin superfamily)